MVKEMLPEGQDERIKFMLFNNFLGLAVVLNVQNESLCIFTVSFVLFVT